MYETVLIIFYTTIWYAAVITLNTNVREYTYHYGGICLKLGDIFITVNPAISLIKKSKVQEKYNIRDK